MVIFRDHDCISYNTLADLLAFIHTCIVYTMHRVYIYGFHIQTLSSVHCIVYNDCSTQGVKPNKCTMIVALKELNLTNVQ